MPTVGSKLYNYASAARQHSAEILELVNSQQIHELRACLTQFGIKEYEKWSSQEEMKSITYELLSITPSHWDKRIKKIIAPLGVEGYWYPMIVLVTWRAACRAHILIDVLSRRFDAMSPGVSYRDATAAAALTFEELYFHLVADWPSAWGDPPGDDWLTDRDLDE